jgi:hypothetical protein
LIGERRQERGETTEDRELIRDRIDTREERGWMKDWRG